MAAIKSDMQTGSETHLGVGKTKSDGGLKLSLKLLGSVSRSQEEAETRFNGLYLGLGNLDREHSLKSRVAVSATGVAVMKEGILEGEKDSEKTQFQLELNRFFESRGIIADLRSHLRHLMIMALKSTQGGLKSTDRSSPKAQALNLMVAEYLFRHRCHYTLSVFTSEVPTLASFNPAAGKPSETTNRCFRGNCFQENEVEEIFNALGISSHDEELAFLKTTYLEKGDRTSLVELFLQAIVEMTVKLRICQNLKSHAYVEGERLLSEQWSKKIVDVLLSEKLSPPQITALEEFIFRITENEVKRIVVQEQRQQLQILSEREKRIQQYLKKHEEDIRFRLEEAEKDLKRRRDIIDEELTEREKYLTKIAVEWKNKHEEILKLSKNFHDIEEKNKDLQNTLKAFEQENINLKTQEKSQKQTIEDLRKEVNMLINKLKEVTDSNAILSERVQALISHENKEVFGHHDVINQKPSRTILDEIPLLWSKTITSDGDVNVISRHKEFSPKVKSKEFTVKNQIMPYPDQWNITETEKMNLGSGEAQQNTLLLNFDSPEDEEDISFSSSEEIILSVRKKLQDLEEETNKINQNYLKYKKNCFSVDSDSENSRNHLDKSPPISKELIIKETKFCQTNEDLFIKLQKLKEKEAKNEFDASLTKKLEASPRKLIIRAPTNRQLKNRDFFLKSRQLLEAFENQKVENAQSSSSAVDSPVSSSGEELAVTSKQLKNVKSVLSAPLRTLSTYSTKALQIQNTLAESTRKIESHIPRNGIECLAVLEEVRINSPRQVAARKCSRQRLLTESEKEKEKINSLAEPIVGSPTSTPSEKISFDKKS